MLSYLLLFLYFLSIDSFTTISIFLRPNLRNNNVRIYNTINSIVKYNNSNVTFENRIYKPLLTSTNVKEDCNLLCFNNNVNNITPFNTINNNTMDNNNITNDINDNNTINNKDPIFYSKELIKKTDFDKVFLNIHNIKKVYYTSIYDRVIIEYNNNNRNVYYFDDQDDKDKMEMLFNLKNENIKRIIISDFHNVMDPIYGYLRCEKK